MGGPIKQILGGSRPRGKLEQARGGNDYQVLVQDLDSRVSPVLGPVHDNFVPRTVLHYWVVI
jgi:hypothetical protein